MNDPLPLVREPAEIHSDWLSAALGRNVEFVSCKAIGDGQMSRTFRVGYRDDGTDRSVVVKLSAGDSATRANCQAMRAYTREVAFYRELADRRDSPAPAFLGAAIDDDGEWFTLVIEDAPGSAGDQLRPAPREVVASTLNALARLQGGVVGDHVLGAADWLNLPWPLTQAMYEAVLPGFIERFGPRVAPEHLDVVRWFSGNVDDWLADRRAPLGLVHGDLRSDNLLSAGDATTIVDWQSVTWGPVIRDIAYLIGGSMDAQERRVCEEALVRQYVEEVVARGRSAWKWEDAWEAYRHQALYGLLLHVIASMVVASTERGDAMFATLIARHAQHALDLHAAATIRAPQGALVPDSEDEGPHVGASDKLWSESYYFDAAAADGSVGVYVRTGRLDGQGKTHAVATVVRRGQPSALLIDPGAALPAGAWPAERYSARTFDVTLECLEPLKRFRVAVDGSGEAHADPAGPLHRSQGAPVQVSLDLTWTTDAVPYRWRLATRYEIPCRVSGHIEIDDERIEFDGPGQRDHSWGPRDWWQADWCWSAVHLEDGSRLHTVSVPGLPSHSVGYSQAAGHLTELTAVTSTVTPAPEGLFGTTVIAIEPGMLSFELTPLLFSPIRMDSDDGRVSFFPRALCRVTASDGRNGVGWVEWNRVQRTGG